MVKEKFSVKISRINSITFGAKYASPVICDGLLCSTPGTLAWRETGGSEGPAAGRTNQRSPVGTWESVQPLARFQVCFMCHCCPLALPGLLLRTPLPEQDKQRGGWGGVGLKPPAKAPALVGERDPNCC